MFNIHAQRATLTTPAPQGDPSKSFKLIFFIHRAKNLLLIYSLIYSVFPDFAFRRKTHAAKAEESKLP
jgi:hypothetical protein